MKLNILHQLPEQFFDCEPKDLYKIFDGPTLICLEGKIKEPLFISTMLHGNETSSFYAIREILRLYDHLPRSIIIFIGNIEAAKAGLRHLPGQVDFNRIWSGGEEKEQKMAQEVVEFARSQNLFASIDIHNNTGTNPYYPCINKLDPEFVHLAALFSKTIIYFEEPHQVQSMAFSKICPAVTLECGKSGDEQGLKVLVHYLKKILSLENLTDLDSGSEDVFIYKTVARLKLKKGASLDFDFSQNSENDLSLALNFDCLNFETLKIGSNLGFINNEQALEVLNDDGDVVNQEFFEIQNKKLILKRSVTPSMLTQNIQIAKDDCLGYLMEEMKRP